MEMEESFNVRVNKIFGSLSSSSSSSSSSKSESLSSLWCLTDDEIEKQEWNRDKDSPEPEPGPWPRAKQFRPNKEFGEKKAMGFRTELEKDLDELDDDVEEAGASSTSSKGAKPDDYNDEEWEIKSSIGLDCTLDYEEEEDDYDKVAVGKEGVHYLYLDDINDYQTEADSYRGLPTSFKDVIRDPRANHIAAKIRLKEDAEAAKRRLEEDAEAAKKINSLRVSENDALATMSAQISTSEDGNLKSILKRKDAESDSKSQKRVRFDSECKYDGREESEGTKDVAMEASPAEEAKVSNQVSVLPQDFPSGIPDYMRNPSKYTRYTFDSSSDIDEESNRQAYMDFLKLLKKSDTTESKPDDSSDEPKSVTFIPRRKSGDATMRESSVQSKQKLADYGREPMQKRGLPIGIAAEDTDDDGVCMMEEDEPQTAADKKSSSQRSGRQYRMKPCSELDKSNI